eukprot:XP_016665076.1 PREDICTED: filamin-A-interacting protein 1-like isoform X2 [Acyrthosiphon pisum]
MYKTTENMFERETSPTPEKHEELHADVYYESVIAERNELRKENADLIYKCSELDADNKLLRIEINTKEKEKTDIREKYKDNSIKLPKYQAKVNELKKDKASLTTKNESLLLEIGKLRAKCEEIEKKYEDNTDLNKALVIKIQKLEKTNAKFKQEKDKEQKVKLQTKAENDNTKAKADDLEKNNKTLQLQISQHNDELRSKDILVTELNRKLKILGNNFDDASVSQKTTYPNFISHQMNCTKLNSSETHVKDLEQQFKDKNKEWQDTKLKHSSLLRENNNLKAKLDESKELQLTVDTLRTNESGLKKQINGLKQDIIREQSENGILTKRIHELEKQKTVYVCRSEDITVTKKELKKCMDEKESCENRFSNLDCPFYQSKYGKLEDKMPKIKYGSINESHYIKKISVLEQQIKNLHSKIHSQGEEQRKYEEKVGEVWHENKNLKKSLEELNALLEKQTEEINYDKVKMMGKDSKIRNLEKEMNARDNKCKSVNRELGIAHRKILDVQKEMGSMKKDNVIAKKIIENAEKYKAELSYKAEHSEKCCSDIKKIELECQQKIQKLEIDAKKIESTNEKFQKKINKLTEELNKKNQEHEELKNSFKNLKTEDELNKKNYYKCIDDMKNKQATFSNANNALKLKNDHMSKFEKDNAELKSKIQDYERNLVYQQKRMNAYENK